MQEKKKRRITVKIVGVHKVNHKFTYFGVLIGSYVDPVFKKLSNILPEESLEWMGPGFIKTFTTLRIGNVTKEPNEKDSYRTRVLWEEAKRRGIDMIEFHMFNMGGDIFLSRYKGKEHEVF
jgi:hypothetical protein